MAFLDAIPLLFTPLNIGLIFVGVLVGIVVGIIPGLSAAMAVALLIPFTYSLEPINGMAMLVAVFVGGLSGGCITALLLRMPGTPSSVATLLDGYPMASGGQAGRAIGLAVFSSMVGTLISAAILIVAAPVAAAFAVKFYFPEYVAVCIFGLTAIAALSGDTLLKGLFAAGIGLFAATIGMSQEDGVPRFDFEQDSLLAGLNLLPALIGLFAVAQIMKEASKGRNTKTQSLAMTDSVIPRLSDLRKNVWNFIRSGLIGTIVGVMPAMGGGPAGLISYAQAKNAARKTETPPYGQGAPGGVIAAETANNATIGGALIIMLTLGIPGDPVSAVLIGGLMIHGLQPGPQLFTNNAEVVYSVYLSMLVSSFMMAAILFSFSKLLSRVALVPGYILHPPLLLFASIGVYGLNNNLFDVWVMFGFGVLGYTLERLRVPLPPLVLGLVLGPILEGNLRKMVGTFDGITPLFTQPIALTFMLMALASVLFAIYMQIRQRRDRRTKAE
ncbi:MAG: tripartite tricarboxylate transporter permease [Pseudomonadota bacterium]|nr:tripartite tricarboxylate transporter permease [Pseudomonadota bacterium]